MHSHRLIVKDDEKCIFKLDICKRRKKIVMPNRCHIKKSGPYIQKKLFENENSKHIIDIESNKGKRWLIEML